MEHFELAILIGAVLFSWVIGSKTRVDRVAGRDNGPGVIRRVINFIISPDPVTPEQRAATEARQAEIISALQQKRLPAPMQERLQKSRDGTGPWIATLTPAEMLIARSHGFRPIAAVSATCWLRYGYSWTLGHMQGWETALDRLRQEAKAAGANAVLDVKMRTISLDIEDSMDFTLIGTAVKIDGLPPSKDPIVATIPALEFVKLIEAGIVPIGLAIGAEFQWLYDWQRSTNLRWMGNVESTQLSQLWENVRRVAHQKLRENAEKQGGSALAHINFSQMFEREVENQPKQYLARHIVIATTVDAPRIAPHADRSVLEKAGLYQPVKFVVDMHAGKTPLTGTSRHHESYASNEEEGAI